MKSLPTAAMSLDPLRRFVVATSEVVAACDTEAQLRSRVAEQLFDLVARDTWLPEPLAESDPDRYRQYLLYADPLGRFSVVSFVWGPGQCTPIHDHTVWGLIGMLRGEERAQRFVAADDGRLVASGNPSLLRPGEVDAVSPSDAAIGDLHQVSNAFDDRSSISIHVYGANIGAVQRSIYPQPQQSGGGRRPFVSGYSNAWLPNLWHAPTA